MNEYNEPPAWEAAIAQLAREYAYPPTPNIEATIDRSPRTTRAAKRPRQRRAPSWVVGLAVVLALLLLGALAVPQTRAAVLTFIGRIGAIRLFVDETLPTVPTAVAPTTTVVATTTSPIPSPIPLALLSAVPGTPVALDDLSKSAGFPVRLPPPSSEWGSPDAAVLHRVIDRTLVSVIWDDTDEPGRPVLVLSQTDMPELAYKMIGAGQVTEVIVNGQKGMWIQGPHRLYLPIDGSSSDGFLASNVLIWADGRMTYRIEGEITLADAIRLAESLSPDNHP